MKTPIQELMQWMEETEFMVNQAFIDKVNECLKKEKEQIIDAVNKNEKHCVEFCNRIVKLHPNLTYNNARGNFFSIDKEAGIKYFDKTYNQNK